ncbi:unnamed protein product [Boreogadus saida]
MHHQAPAMSPQVQSVRVISTISQRSNPHHMFSSSYQTCGGRASIHNITLLKLKHSETSADLPFNEGWSRLLSDEDVGQFQQQCNYDIQDVGVDRLPRPILPNTENGLTGFTQSGKDEPSYCPGLHGYVHNKWDEMWDSRVLQKHPNTYIHVVLVMWHITPPKLQEWDFLK